MLPPPLGFALFIAAFVAARIVHERALRKLSTEEKGKLVEAFASHRLVALLPIAAMAAMYFAMSSFGLSPTVFLATYVPAVLVFALASNVYVFRKLREIGIQPEFVRNFGWSRAISVVGFAMILLSL